MTSDKMALKVAIDLVHVPSRVQLARSEPLPDGMLTILSIAAGDGEAVRLAVDVTGRSQEWSVRRLVRSVHNFPLGRDANVDPNQILAAI
jgi:hypothetical protein